MFCDIVDVWINLKMIVFEQQQYINQFENKVKYVLFQDLTK